VEFIVAVYLSCIVYYRGVLMKHRTRIGLALERLSLLYRPAIKISKVWNKSSCPAMLKKRASGSYAYRQ